MQYSYYYEEEGFCANCHHTHIQSQLTHKCISCGEVYCKPCMRRVLMYGPLEDKEFEYGEWENSLQTDDFVCPFCKWVGVTQENELEEHPITQIN